MNKTINFTYSPQRHSRAIPSTIVHSYIAVGLSSANGLWTKADSPNTWMQLKNRRIVTVGETRHPHGQGSHHWQGSVAHACRKQRRKGFPTVPFKLQITRDLQIFWARKLHRVFNSNACTKEFEHFSRGVFPFLISTNTYLGAPHFNNCGVKNSPLCW